MAHGPLPGAGDSGPVVAEKYHTGRVVRMAVVAALAPVACAVAGKRSGNWKLWGAVGAACAVVGAVALRMAFYSVGASVYLFY